jgi:hypothetical protein
VRLLNPKPQQRLDHSQPSFLSEILCAARPARPGTH